MNIARLFRRNFLQRNDAPKNAKNGAVEAPRPYPAGNAIGKPHSGIAPCAGRGL